MYGHRAAADVLVHNFKDLGVGPEYYDRIITGDLGTVGQRILADMMHAMDIISNPIILTAEQRFTITRNKTPMPAEADVAAVP